MKAVFKYSFEDCSVAETIAQLIRGVTNKEGALFYFEEVHVLESSQNIN